MPRTLFKILAVCALLMAAMIGALALYMRLYGNEHIKQALGELVGARVNFTSTAINLEKQAASFKDFSITTEIGIEKQIFSADTFIIYLDKEMLRNEKAVVIDRVSIKGAKLFIARDERGTFRLILPRIDRPSPDQPLLATDSATAGTSREGQKNALYAILSLVRSIQIEDSTISFEDRFGMREPYTVWCDSFFADLTSRDTGAGYLQAALTAKCRLPQKRYGDGWFGVKASLAAYPDKTNMELTASAGNIDVMVFLPYVSRNTPFNFRSGRFGSKTDFRLHNGIVDSLTTMSFDDVRLTINPYAPNAQFMNVSINRLVPYLTSSGNIIFDFVLKGDARKPEIGVGPRVKYAIGMVVMEEVGKAVGRMDWSKL